MEIKTLFVIGEEEKHGLMLWNGQDRKSIITRSIVDICRMGKK